MANLFTNISTIQKTPFGTNAPTAGEPAKAAPVVKANDTNASTSLDKSPIGVIEPPTDVYQVNLMKDVNERVARAHEEGHDERAHSKKAEGHTNEKKTNGTNVLGAANLAGETSKRIGFWGNLAILAGVVALGVLGFKKVKAAMISDINVNTIAGAKDHLKALIEMADNGKPVSKSLQSIDIRISGKNADAREALKTLFGIVEESRNIEGQTPVICVKLDLNAAAEASKIKQAFRNGAEGIERLSEAVLKKVNMVSLEYGPKPVRESNDFVIITPFCDVRTGTAGKIASENYLFESWRNLFK